jgi:hypothetical protein
MNCVEARKLVHLFVDGVLDCRANVDVLAHLNMCGACSGRFDEAKKFEEFMASRLRAPACPEGVRMRVELLVAELAAPWYVRVPGGFRRRPLAAMSGAAALLAISLAGWKGYCFFGTCPYVRDATGTFQALMPMAIGGSEAIADAGRAPAIRGLRCNGSKDVLFSTVHRDVRAYSYAMDNCPDEKACTVLFMLDSPGFNIGDHEAVTVDGRKYTRWEYDDCSVVVWKNEKLGVVCMMVCRKEEMPAGHLLNLASMAASAQ